jgi:hypothetical protein
MFLRESLGSLIHTVPEVQMLLVLIMRLQLKRNFQLLVLLLQYLPDGQSILLVISEDIDNETSNYSLLSKVQQREYGRIIDSICHRRGRAQQMKITDSTNQDDINIPLDLAGFMVHFKHKLPTQEEFTSL